jgi:hypothetical protein
LLLAVGFGVAFAQSASTLGSSAPSIAPTNDAPPGVTSQQMQAQTKSFLIQMAQSARTVKQQLATAREYRDVVKVLCLSDKLTQIDVATAAARDRFSSLNSAIERDKDPRDARYEFTILQVLHERVRTLVQESTQCVGEESGFLGESKVIVHVDNALPSNDTTQYPQDTADVVTQMPPPASPVR